MLNLKRLLSRSIPAQDQHTPKLAVAELLMEIARADLTLGTAERKVIHAHLQSAYELSDAEITELTDTAHARVEASVSLHDTVQLINSALDAERKRALLRVLWQVAYADGRLDPHEEALLRRLSDLLYIPHSVFIQEKLGVAG